MVIEKIDSVSDFQALRPQWDDLLAHSGSDCLFLTWEWMFSWWQHFGAGRELALYAGRSGDALDLIAPFATRPPQLLRGKPWGALEPLGVGSVGSDYLDVVVRQDREREGLDRLATRLREDGVVLSVPRTHADASCVRELAERLARHGWFVDAAPATVAPYIPLAAHTWESYLDSLGREHRSNFRRRLRKLQERFDVRIDRAGTDAEREQALEVLIRLHNDRWRSRGGSTAFHQTPLVHFHQRFSRLALEREWLRLYLLRLDGEAVAALYGFRYADTFLFYQSGFDPRFAPQGVGLVLMGLVIREAIAEGAAEFDLLHGAEPYKFLWSGQTRELSNLELYPPTARGVVSHRLSDLSRTARAAVRRVASSASAV